MEYSGGCESGWTMYLDQSAEELASIGLAAKGGYHQEVVEEEEDLSMVSDASSGPAMFHDDDDEEEENYGIGNLCSRPVSVAALAWKNDNRMRIQRKGLAKHDSLVDDTASSYALGCSKNDLGFNNKNAQVEGIVDFSKGFSFNAYKGKSTFQDHCSYLQMPPGKATSEKSVCKSSRRHKKW